MMETVARKPLIALAFGTRPEAVKMVPVIRALKARPELSTLVISTGQHKQMLTQILERFDIRVDHEMDLMEPNQSLYRLSSKAIAAFEEVLTRTRPDMMLVQGDTTTAFLGALCAFYGKIPVGHVEAGLRTNDKYFPFPEEINRRLITACADINFCPTQGNKDNLLREGLREETMIITGNTGIDTLLLAAAMEHPFPLPDLDLRGKRMILVTVHRRESFGEPMERIFSAIRELADAYPDAQVVYPVHLNPNVQKPAREILGGVANIHLVPPMDYFDFVALMGKAHLILTDSGGVQEEAPTLGVPVLVLRNETERPEAVQAGTVRLAGTRREDIVREARLLLDNEAERAKLAGASNPYGDGKAAPRIVAAILKHFGL
ncbi:MAG: UDP-N-acetylglucosamine 2-epimerase [Fibrobacteres bacterium]|nr:UDP-N-acetylglucosamine 2-epimerase [Fibrobacterota bacterium]